MEKIRALLWVGINAVQAVFVAVWSALWISVALLTLALTFSRRPGLWLARRIWSPGILAIAPARLEIQGLDRLDLSQACFFAANHQSWVDIPALFVAVPVPLLFVAKRELGRVPFLGWYVAAMGMILIDRSDRAKSAASIARVAERLRQGWSVLTFPEGSRSRDGAVQPFKSAAFAAAIDAGAPVVPVALTGAGRILPRDGFHPRPGPIRVYVGEPIPTSGLNRADRGDLARRVQQEVESLLTGAV
jgi:1-acyl-sn-glycerol-3-phosphate acyltransferase